MGERLEATEEERGDKEKRHNKININKFALSCEPATNIFLEVL